MKKTIVILANSVKHSQHCVAGKDIITKKWIRPVKNIEGCELSHEQAKCKNPHGIFPISVLQKIEIEFSCNAPLINQPENYVITDCVWLQRYKLERNELNAFLDNPEILWDNESSSGSGSNDRIDYNKILNENIKINQSLYLISPDSSTVLVTTNIENKKRIRVSFTYRDVFYNLATTDPVIWKEYSSRETGEYQFENPKILCISLGEKFDDGFCYKLVASAI